MHRYVHRTGVGVIGWRQASGVAVAATLAPRDSHRKVLSRGRVVRSVGGYGVVSGGATASASITTADSTFAGSAAVSPIAAAAITTAGSVFTGSATAAPALATLAPRDSHRKVLSRGRVVRSVGGYGVVSGGATASASITTADSTFAGSAAVSPIAAAAITTAGSVFTGSATAAPALAMMAATAANAVMVGSAVGDIAPVSDLDADRFDYRRALRMPSAYGLDPAIARMGLRMTRRTRW